MDLLADPIVEPKIAPIKYRISAAIIDFLIIWLKYLNVRQEISGRTKRYDIYPIEGQVFVCQVFLNLAYQRI